MFARLLHQSEPGARPGVRARPAHLSFDVRSFRRSAGIGNRGRTLALGVTESRAIPFSKSPPGYRSTRVRTGGPLLRLLVGLFSGAFRASLRLVRRESEPTRCARANNLCVSCRSCSPFSVLFASASVRSPLLLANQFDLM